MATKKKPAKKKPAKKTPAKNPRTKRSAKKAKLSGIPAGYTNVAPVVAVKDCAKALEFWSKAFGAKVRSTMPAPGGLIMHAEVRIGDGVFMCSDPMMGAPITGAMHLYSKDAAALFQRAVDAGCTVEMPLADQFWGDSYGVLRDAWGIRWSIGQQKERVSPKEMMKRMAALPPMGQ